MTDPTLKGKWALVTGATAGLGQAVATSLAGAGANIVMGTSQVTGNGTGVSQVNGGTVSSFGNNEISSNGADGTPLPMVSLN